jgi:hypothetical protein
VARGDAKVDPRKIIRAHRRTYVDAQTGKVRWQDYLTLEVAPVVAGAACLAFDVRLGASASTGLLTVAALLSAFLFTLMLQMSERAMDWADSRPAPGPDTSARAVYLEELAANAGYASLVCIAAAVTFVIASVGSGWVLRIASALGLALSAHLALVLMMVMKRVFTLTQDRLNRARTGTG